MRRFAVIAVSCLALPAVADAQVPVCVAPPGTAAIEQYCEQVLPPSDDGDPTGPVTLPRATNDDLAETSVGQAVLRSIGPVRTAGPSDTGRPADRPSPKSSDSNAFGAISDSLKQLDGLGFGVLWVCFAILAAMSVWFASSRRGRDV